MIRVLIAVSFAASILCFGPAVVAAEYGTKEEAVAMVKRVQEKFKKDGADATFKAVSDKSIPELHDRDLYPFVYDMNGLNVAHGARPALIGKNLIDLKDQDGKYLIREMVKIASGPGRGWIDYKWPNPISNKIEDKSSYVEKMGDYFVGVGIYKP
jgi:cytochrome c